MAFLHLLAVHDHHVEYALVVEVCGENPCFEWQDCLQTTQHLEREIVSVEVIIQNGIVSPLVLGALRAMDSSRFRAGQLHLTESVQLKAAGEDCCFLEWVSVSMV